MVGEIDLYNYPRRLELSLRKMNEDSLVCAEDKQAILGRDFMSNLSHGYVPLPRGLPGDMFPAILPSPNRTFIYF
jgi:hypothetical protein